MGRMPKSLPDTCMRHSRDCRTLLYVKQRRTMTDMYDVTALH